MSTHSTSPSDNLSLKLLTQLTLLETENTNLRNNLNDTSNVYENKIMKLDAALENANAEIGELELRVGDSVFYNYDEEEEAEGGDENVFDSTNVFSPNFSTGFVNIPTQGDDEFNSIDRDHDNTESSFRIIKTPKPQTQPTSPQTAEKEISRDVKILISSQLSLLKTHETQTVQYLEYKRRTTNQLENNKELISGLEKSHLIDLVTIANLKLDLERSNSQILSLKNQSLKSHKSYRLLLQENDSEEKKKRVRLQEDCCGLLEVVERQQGVINDLMSECDRDRERGKGGASGKDGEGICQ